ncbi:MAG: hypothetical protein WC598_11755 [Methanoregula sp.]
MVSCGNEFHKKPELKRVLMGEAGRVHKNQNVAAPFDSIAS